MYEFTQSSEFTIGRQRKIYEEYLHSNYTINTGVRSRYLRNDGPSNIGRLEVSHSQWMRLIIPRCTSTKMMRHELQMLPVEYSAKLSRAKLYRRIRGNTNHPLHTTINRRKMKWMDHWDTGMSTTRIKTIWGTNTTTKRRHRPWGTTNIRMLYRLEETEILKQRLLEYIRSEPDDNTYYTDGSSDGERVSAERER